MVRQAFLSAEDADFYSHWGVNLAAVARAFFSNWHAGHTMQGGSTITQQVVKYLLLTQERSYRRKIQEIILMGEITRVPQTPPYVKGLINLRSNVIPIIDLRSRFGLAEASVNDDTRIMVVNVNGKLLRRSLS